MSAREELDEILSEGEPSKVLEPARAEVMVIMSEGESARVLELAVKEARGLFSATGVSLADVCTAVEGASSRTDLQEALGRFNQILHNFFLSSSPMT